MAYLSYRRKLLIVIAAFVVAADAGVVLLAVILIVLPQIARQCSSGIGTVVSGLSETAVFLVPILCGTLGVVLMLHLLNRPKALPTGRMSLPHAAACVRRTTRRANNFIPLRACHRS
jgi:hypothetical protein